MAAAPEPPALAADATSSPASPRGALLDLRARVSLASVARKVRDAFVAMWSFRQIFFFIGSVTAMHFFGDELAV